MPTDIDNLTTAYNNICAKIAAVSAALGPDYTIDGVTMSKSKWMEDLIRQRNMLAEIVTAPFEIVTRGRT